MLLYWKLSIHASTLTPRYTLARNPYIVSDLLLYRQCPCGEIGSCTTPGSNCNCDGNGFITSYDYGKLTDKNQLPVTKLVFGRISGISKAYHTLSALYCGPRQFGRYFPDYFMSVCNCYYSINFYLFSSLLQLPFFSHYEY